MEYYSLLPWVSLKESLFLYLSSPFRHMYKSLPYEEKLGWEHRADEDKIRYAEEMKTYVPVSYIIYLMYNFLLEGFKTFSVRSMSHTV